MRFYLFILIGLFIYFSCEKEVPIDLSLKEKRIVINSFFNNEEFMHVNLSSNQPSTDKDTAIFLDNAIVLLYENDLFLDTLKLRNKGNYFSDKIIPEKAVPYKLVVEVPGIQTATTDFSMIPVAVNDFSLDTSSFDEIFSGNEYRKVKLRFKDIENVPNYYLISMNWLATSYVYDTEGNVIDSIQTKVAYGWGSEGINIPYISQMVFSDELMEGDTIEKNLYFYKDMYGAGLQKYDHLMAYFKLCTISEEYYLYAKSYTEQYNSIDWAVFVEPVTVFSNIKNGYGIFAGYGQCIDSVFYRE